MNKKYDVVGMGAALLDFIIEVDDQVFDSLGIVKGTMRLVAHDEGEKLLSSLQSNNITIAPGGSSANTIAGVSVLGGKTAFIGTVGTDEYGSIYESSTKNNGTETSLKFHVALKTGYAITLVTPDGERSFAVYLGASPALYIDENSKEIIAQGSFLHLEGYQFDTEEGIKATLTAIEIAKANDTKVSIDFSDVGVIERHRELIDDIFENHADIVFVNEHEAKALTGVGAEEAVHALSRDHIITVVKHGEKGSYIKSSEAFHTIEAYVSDLVNTNGAGDMYAAGILYGLTHDLDLFKTGQLASYSASRVVAQQEARLNERNQKDVCDFLFNI